MEFTESFNCWNGQVKISPNGLFGCYLREDGFNKFQLLLLEAQTGRSLGVASIPVDHETGQHFQIPFKCTPKLELSWSPDSKNICVMQTKNSRLLIWKLSKSGPLTVSPFCIIQENRMLGINDFVWSSCSRHLIIILRNQIGLRVWRLTEKFPVAFIESPKFGNGKSIIFDSNSNEMAVLQRRDCKDFISFFDIRSTSWKCVRKLSVPDGAYLDGICHVPLKSKENNMGRSICGWESPAGSNKVYLFEENGTKCRILQRSDFAETGQICFGYEKVFWNNNGLIGALLKDKTSFLLINSLGLKLSTDSIEISPWLIHPSDTIVFKERLISSIESKYESGLQLHISKATDVKDNSSMIFLFSPTSRFAAIHSPIYPFCVWIYDFLEMKLASVLQQLTIIKSLQWHLSEDTLVIATSSPNLFIWQPNGAMCVSQPVVKDTCNLQWATESTLFINSSSSFCLAIPDWTTF